MRFGEGVDGGPGIRVGVGVGRSGITIGINMLQGYQLDLLSPICCFDNRRCLSLQVER